MYFSILVTQNKVPGHTICILLHAALFDNIVITVCLYFKQFNNSNRNIKYPINYEQGTNNKVFRSPNRLSGILNNVLIIFLCWGCHC